MDYTEFVNNVFSIMNTVGILEPIRYFVLFALAAAGVATFVRFLRGL